MSTTKRQSNTANVKAVDTRAHAIKALWTLSGFSEDLDVEWFSSLVVKAPDPETACKTITEQLQASSDVLQRKWRKVINETWFDSHPHASPSFDIPIQSEDVVDAPALNDARALLHLLEQRPVRLTWEQGERVIAPQELVRLVKSLPSLRNKDINNLESEWGSITLKRLRHVLQAARLIRVYDGNLTVVHSRYKRFNQLPLPQQFYVLWHADTYHIEWSDLAGQWSRHAQTVQNYLPLLWEMGCDIHGEMEEDIQDIAESIVELFRPLWEQEGVLGMHKGTPLAFLHMYEQSALPAVIEQIVVKDLFIRYGLLHQDRHIPGFPPVQAQWTRLGAVLLQAEQRQDLPCGVDMLGG